MDAISAISSVTGVAAAIGGIVRVVYRFSTVVQEMADNRNECNKLIFHVREVMTLLGARHGDVADVLSVDQLSRFIKLESALEKLQAKLSELSSQSRLKRILWRDDIAETISWAYRELHQVCDLFSLGNEVDIRRQQREHEEARRLDVALLQQQIDQVAHNDLAILNLLGVQRTEMQEAMISIHNRLAHMQESIEGRLLTEGIHALHRRSGGMKTVPDDFAITSLDVIVHYESKIGEGGYGTVFEGDWHGTAVAVKMLGKGLPVDVLQREIDIWKRLRHPHILPFFGACSIADPPFAISALKQADASSYLRSNPDADRIQIILEAILGLIYLHEHSVVHGDLKASNILIDERGVACLADFGLSKLRMHTTTIRSRSTGRMGTGTSRWMSPEQMCLGIINRKTDIYSLAMTIYEIYAGVPPFAHAPDSLVLEIVSSKQKRPPLPENMPVEIQKLVQDCWAHDPEQRPSAIALPARIRPLCRPKTVTSSSAGSSEETDNSLKVPMADSTTSVSGSNPPAHCVINIAPEMAPHIDPMLAASRWSLLSDFERALEDIWQTTTSHEQNTPQADDIIQLYFESFDDAPAADSDPPPLAHSVYARTDTPDIGSIVDRFEYQASLAEASAALPDSPLIHGLPQSEEMSRMSLLAMPRVGDPVNVSLWDLATFSARRNWPPSRLEVEDRIVMPFQAHRTSASGPRVEGLFTCQHADSYDVHRIVLFSVFLWSDDHKLLDELAQPEAVDVSYVLSEKYSLQGFDQPSHRVTRHGKPGRVIRVNDNPTHGDSTLTLPRSDGSSVGSQSSLPTPVDAQGVISLSQFLDELDTQARTSPAIHATPQSPHGGPSRSRTLSMRPFGRPGTASSETIRSTTCSEESPAKVRFMEGLREVIPRAVLRGPHLRSKPHASEVQAGKPSQSVTLVDFLEEGRLPSPASAKIPRRHSGVPGVNSSVGVPRRARSFTPREPTVRSDPGSRAVLQFIQESDVRRTEKKAVNHPEEEGTVVRLDGYIQVPGLPRPRREWTSFERQTFLHLLIEHPRLSNEPGPGAMQPIHVEIPLQKELIHVHPVDDTIPSTMLFRDRASS